MRTQIEGDYIAAFPTDRITYDNAPFVEKELGKIIEDNPGKVLLIDADELSYVSSAGLRVLFALPRHNDDKLIIRNADPELFEILDMTGFTELFDVRKKMKTISIEGCEVIGKGAFGTVYKVDEDTIVKVYDSPDCLPMIENERKRSKQAFINGIPTAISYDIVRVGDSYGSVFELLHADNFNDYFLSEPDKEDEIIEQYVNMLKTVHSVEIEPGKLPHLTDNYIGWLDKLKGVIPDDVDKGIRDLILKMPEDNHIVHGDVQMKNVMFAGNEPMLIDMESISTGDPVFDLAGLFVCYKAYNEDEPDNTVHFLGMEKERSDRLWDKILNKYFEGLPEEQIRKEEDKIRLPGYVVFLNNVVTNGFTKPELKDIRIEHSVAHMRELLSRVTTLVTADL